MASVLCPEVRTPTGDERLRLDFLAASQEERNRFLAWMENFYLRERQKVEAHARPWSFRWSGL